MPTTGRSGTVACGLTKPPGLIPAVACATCFAVALVLMASTADAAEKTPLAALASLSTALGDNDADGALEFFDSGMAHYGQIEQNIEALTAQDDVSCAIDIVTDTETNGVHKLDLDWFMELKSQGATAQTEQRRVRVAVEMRLIKGHWKITSLAPVSIFDPIAIR